MTRAAPGIRHIGRGAFEMPDGSVAYTMKRAAEEYKKIKPVEYTASDVILLLLSSRDGPIAGRASLFKGLFLLERDVLGGESVEDCLFVPYYRRPHSFYLALKIGEMARRGLIEAGGLGRAASYALTQKGLERAAARRRTVPAALWARTRELRDGLERRGSSRMLDAACRRTGYAKYAPRSRVAHRYRAITWGRGI